MSGRSILIEFLGKATNLKSTTKDAEQALGGVETKTGSASSAIGNLIQKIPGVGSSFKSVKGNLDEAGQAAEHAGGGVLGAGVAAGTAGVAIGAFALKAVADYTKSAIAAGNFATTTGNTVEQSSRWIEVADDHGVAADTVEAAFGRMNKTAGLTPGVFDTMGVAIAKNKDGTIDSNATFLNAIEVLKNTNDAARQAEIGNAIFGRGWKSMAGIISEGAPGLRKDLESVQASKVFNADDVKAAKGVRDGLDAIKDAGEGLMLTVGKALAPVIAELAPKLGALLDKVAPLADAVGGALVTAFKLVGPVIDGVLALLGPLAKALGTVTNQIPNMIAALGGSRGGLKDQTQSTKDLIDQFVQLDDKYKKVGEGGIRFTGDVHQVANALEDQKELFGSNTDAIEKMRQAVKDHGDELSGKMHGTFVGYSADLQAAQTAQDNLEVSTQTIAQASIHADDTIAAHKQSVADLAAQEALAASKQADLATAIDLENTARESGIQDLKDHADALQADIDKEKELADNLRAQQDSTFAVDKATVDFNDTLDGLAAELKAAKGHSDKQKVAYDGVKQSAQDLADAHLKLEQDTAKANGTTLTAAQSTDILNGTLINTAAQARGPARQAMLDYIASVNGIPAEKETEIQAAIDAGDLDTANRLLADASRTRTASVVVDADQASLQHVNGVLADLSKDRVVQVRVSTTGGVPKFAGGGRASGLSIINDGPGGGELVDLPDGSVVVPADKTDRILGAPARATTENLADGTGGDMHFHYNQNAPVYGVDDLNTHLNRWAQGLAAKINAGRRQ